MFWVMDGLRKREVEVEATGTSNLDLCLPQTHSEPLPQQVEALSVAIVAVFCRCGDWVGKGFPEIDRS